MKRGFLIVGFWVFCLHLSAYQCDSLLVQKLDNYYRLYQDDSLRKYSTVALSQVSESSICHYHYTFYLINSYLYNDLEKAKELSFSLKRSKEPKKEVLRLAALQSIYNRQNEHRKRLAVLKTGESVAASMEDSSFKSRWHYFFLKSLAKTYARLAVYDSAVSYALRFTASPRTSLKLDGYLTLSSIYTDFGDQKSAFDELKKGLLIVDQNELQDEPRLVCNLYNNIGAAYIYAYKYDSALIYLEKSLMLAKKLEDAKMTYARIINIGLVNMELGAFEEARRNYMEGLEIIQQTEGEAKAYKLHVLYENLAELEVKLNNFPLALVHADKSLSFAQEANRKELEIDAYALLA